MARKDQFLNTTYVSEDGRVQRVVTSQDEADQLESQGWSEGELAGRDAATANRGREGNQKAAESSTTRKLNDGVDRTATSRS
jgi:hypothetical protein